MAHIDPRAGFRPSIIARLIDPDSEGSGFRAGYSVNEVIESVRQDLEDLLNSHCMTSVSPDEFPEVYHSIVTFGVPDLASQYSTQEEATSKVATAIEEVVKRFEPRLKDVRALPVVGADTSKNLSLNFEIQGTLRMDPSPDVSFVTVLKLTTGEAEVQQATVK